MSTLRAAVVGAGPSGFYATDQLLKAGFEVDLIELLPTPFGLVRAGVAPDHPKIKSVTRVYEKTAPNPGFRFFGGVELGDHICREDLLERYHVRALRRRHGGRQPTRDPGGGPARIALRDRVRGLVQRPPRLRRPRVRSERKRAVVIGNGNVAVDVARMLVLHPDEVSVTDTADHAVGPLAAAQVEDVIMLGRRGPAQAAFTNPELRELGVLIRADVMSTPPTWSSTPRAPTGSSARASRPTSATSRSCASTRSASRTATAGASSCASCAPPSRSSARARTGPSPASAW